MSLYAKNMNFLQNRVTFNPLVTSVGVVKI